MCLAQLICVSAQNDITIGLVMPESLGDINKDAIQLLQSRLEKQLGNTGVATYGGDIVIYPTINVINSKLIEAGIKNFYKVELDLTLNTCQYATKTLFSTESWKLVGTGERDEDDAIKNAFNQLSGSDSKFNKFVEDSKLKIKKYYAANKGAIISKANKLAATGDYEAAIALLSNYPTQAVGSNEAQITLRKIYSKYQSVNSGKILQQARAAFASNDYESAAALASQIGPDSNRYGEAKLLINKIRNTVEKEKNAANNRAMRALQISADVEKNRTNAIASIARAYYGRHIINYNVIHL